MFGAGSGNFPTKATKWAAGLLFAIAILLSMMQTAQAHKPGSDFEQTRDLIRQKADEVIRKGSFVRAASSKLILHEWSLQAKAKPAFVALPVSIR